MNLRHVWRTSARSFIVLFLVLASAPAFAFTYYSRANGNWTSATTWSTDAVNQCLGAAAAGVPGAGDDVFICAGFTVTFNSASDVTVMNLTVRGTLTHSVGKNLICNSLALYGLINGAGTKDIQIGNAAFSTLSGTGTFAMTAANLSVLNDLSIQSGSLITFNANGKFDVNNKNVTNNGRIEILDPADLTGTPGNFINNGATAYLKYTKNADFPNLLVASSIGNTVEFGQTSGGPYTIGSAADYYNLIFTGATPKRLTASPTTIGGDLTINNGATLDVNNNNVAIAGNWINNLGGSFTEGSRAVTFFGFANNQSILVPAGGETFYDLIINNTFAGGTVTPNGTINITSGRTLTMTSGILNMGTNTLGETAASAKYTATGGELRIAKTGILVPELTGAYTLTGGTTTFNGAGAQTIRGGVNYFNVNVNTSGGSGTKTLNAAVIIDGALNISTGTLDVSASNFGITANGNWTNTGTFVPRNGTVTTNGSGIQTFTNASTETFYNLTTNATGPLTLGVNTDIFVTNTLTMTSGDFNLNGRTLTLGNGSVATLVRTSGIMYGGTFKRYVAAGTAISSTVAPLYGLFPIGIAGGYRPVAINSTANPTASGYISATHVDANTKIDLSPTYNDAGTVMTRVHAMQSTLTTAGLVGGTYNIDVSMTALIATGNLTDERLLVYTGGTTASAVGTHAATTGSVGSPTGKRTGLTAANLNNSFVIGTSDLVATPLGPDFFYARVSGLWSSNTTWSEDAVLGCAGPASTIIPRSTDNVIICAGVTVTFDLGSTTTIRNLTIQASGVLTMTASQILICNSLVLNGTINGAGSKDLRIGNIAGSTLSGTGTFARTDANGNLQLLSNVTIPNSTDYITFNNNGRLDCNGSTLTNNGRVDMLNPSTFVANGTFLNATANSYLKITTQSNLPNGVISATATGNTVEFASDGVGPFALANLPLSYYNLIFSGTATKRLGPPVQIVLGNLTIANGTTLDSNGNNLTVAGDWINNLGGSFTENSDKVTFNGVSINQNIFTPAGGETFADLTINNTFAGGIVQANGNINITASRTLTMTSGTLNMLTNTLGQTAANANFTATGGNLQLAKTNTTLPELTGTYNVTGGTITFNGVGNQTIRSLNAAPANYHNIVLANAGNKTLAGNVLVRGDWTNNSASLVAGTNTVTFAGAGLQTITSDSNEPFYNLTVNTTGPLTLQSATDITVSNTLTMTNGLINADGRTLTLGSSGVASTLVRTASTTTNWIYGGTFKRFWLAATTVSSTVAPLYGLFPLGATTASSYRPLEINTTVNPTGGGFFTAEHIDWTNIITLSPQYNDAGTNIQGISKAQFITAISGVTGGTYNINVTMTGFSAGTLSDIRLAVFTGGTTASAVGTHAAASGTAPNPTAKRTGITTLTNFNNDFRVATINIGATPLPIELTKFSAAFRSGEVAIEWRTETETNNDLFVVQRSATAEKFTDVAEIKGAGTSTAPTSYIIYDKPTGGTWYYRLKQIDFDGNFTYSKLVSVDVPETSTHVAYPNPSTGDALSINFDYKDLGNTVSMLVQDLNGLEVATLPSVKLDSTTLKVIMPQRLLPGIYILSFSVGDQVVRQKVIVR
jgi:hypothetical protein